MLYLRFRYFAKLISMPIILGEVTLFAYQFLPIYIGKGLLFWFMLVAIIFWDVDVSWSYVHGLEEIKQEMRNLKRKTIERKMNNNKRTT
jgi:hypothetical protein